MTTLRRFHWLAALVAMGAVSLLSLAIHARAHADHGLTRLLHGSYFATQLNTCVTTRAGETPPTFDRDTLQLIGPAESISFQLRAVTRFDGRGNVHVRGVSMAIFADRVDAGEFPIGPPLEFTCDGTYTVTPAREFELLADCTTPFSDVSPVRIAGAISTDRKTLIFYDTEPRIEEISVGGSVVAERICIAMATDIRARSRN